MAIPPIGGMTDSDENTVQIGALANDDVFIGGVPQTPMFPFLTNIKITFELQSDSPYSCHVVLLFESQTIPTQQQIDGTDRSYPKLQSGRIIKTI